MTIFNKNHIMNIGFKSESIPVKIRMKKGANITEEDKNQSDVTQ